MSIIKYYMHYILRYAHALAGEENFTNSQKAILSSIDLLKNALKCEDHSIDTDSKVLARKNLNDLEEHLKIIRT